MVSEHQKQSNRKTSFWLHSHSFLPLLLPELQVPRKAVFYQNQKNKMPLNPPRQVRQKPTEPTSPSQLTALLVSSPWQPLGEGCKPPTTSTTVLLHAFLCAHQGKLSNILRCSHQESRDVCKNTVTLRNAMVSVCMLPLMIWFQSDSELITWHYLATAWQRIPSHRGFVDLLHKQYIICIWIDFVFFRLNQDVLSCWCMAL